MLIVFGIDPQRQSQMCLGCGQTGQQKGSALLPDCRVVMRSLFVVLEDGAHKQNCEVWLRSDKKRFSKGYPFGTRPLEQRCSVLYLLARLTGKAGCDAVCTPLALAGKWAVVLWPGGSKTIVHFQ